MFFKLKLSLNQRKYYEWFKHNTTETVVLAQINSYTRSYLVPGNI